MSHDLFKQVEITRNALLNEIRNLDSDVVDVQPKGFNNTIHWHIGHVLTVTKQFLFGFPDKSQHIPENYTKLFGNGTKPADWTDDVPSVDTLSEQLSEQLDRMKEIPVQQLDEKLDQPILGQNTFGELACMTVFHEANHLGQIHSMHFTAKAEK